MLEIHFHQRKISKEMMSAFVQKSVSKKCPGNQLRKYQSNMLACVVKFVTINVGGVGNFIHISMFF